MIKVDGREFDVDVTDIGLDVEFIYKYAERSENYVMQYELGAIYYNQSLTFGTASSEDSDFRELFEILSTRSSIDAGTGHNVELWTPLGLMTFLMYPNKLSLSIMKRDYATRESWWTGFSVKFIAVKPVESW